MPIYEFVCPGCRTLFSFFSRRVDTATSPACPRCGKPLSREVSLFAAGRSRAGDADPLGLGDDGLDEDFPDVPDFDASDPRVAGAVAEMGNRIDKLDPNNPAEASKVLREFSQKSGLRFNDKIMGAIDRIAAGDASDDAGKALAEAMEGGHILDSLAKDPRLAAENAPFARDPTLYDM